MWGRFEQNIVYVHSGSAHFVLQPSAKFVLFTVPCLYLLFSCLHALAHTVLSAWNPAPSFFFNGHIHLKSKDFSHYSRSKRYVLPRESYRSYIICLPINEVAHILLLPEPEISRCILTVMWLRGSIAEWAKSRISITRLPGFNLSPATSWLCDLRQITSFHCVLFSHL